MDHFSRRWQGHVPLRQLLWRDMLLIGTVINLGFSFAALMMVAQGVAGLWAAAVHFAALPYNLFLLGAVLRAPQRTARDGLVASVWFAMMLVV